MSIDNSTVKKVAKLARLKVDANEEQNLKNELNNILEWVDKLQKVDTENIDAMLLFHASIPLVSKFTLIFEVEAAYHNCDRKELIKSMFTNT